MEEFMEITTKSFQQGLSAKMTAADFCKTDR